MSSTYSASDLTRDVLADLEESPSRREAARIKALEAKCAAIALSPEEAEAKRRLGLLLNAVREMCIAVHCAGNLPEDVQTKCWHLSKAHDWYADAAKALAEQST